MSQLNRVAGPVLLWGLGVGYVISGDYYGWNFGLLKTGYWGFLAGLGLMFILYTCLVGTIAELSSAIPHSGGPYAFCRITLGKIGGYVCGIGVLMEYIVAPAAVATSIGAYVNGIIPSLPIVITAIGVYIIFTGIHIIGINLSLKVELAFTIIATIMLLIFFVIGIYYFKFENLNEIGGGEWFPNGFSGFWAVLPFAAWFFLGIEGLPMAAEESKNPRKDLPKALKASIITLAVLSILTLTIATGFGGAQSVGSADAPLPAAVASIMGKSSIFFSIISVVGLAGLFASFHGIVLSYSRQTYALSRAGFLPKFLSIINSNKTPTYALIVPGVMGCILVFIGSYSGEAISILVAVSVFGAAVSYIMMMIAAIVLRVKQPNLERHYRVPGGIFTYSLALILSIILLFSGMNDYPIAVLISFLIIMLSLIYYFVIAKKNVSDNFDEEMKIIQNDK